MSANAWLNEDGTMKLDPNLPYNLTIRVHDPLEKTDAAMSTSWAQIKVARADVSLSAADFIAKYIVPALPQLKNLKLT